MIKQLECVAKPSLMAARPSKLSKRRSYTFRHYWTKVHLQRRFSVNILLQWEDIRQPPCSVNTVCRIRISEQIHVQ